MVQLILHFHLNRCLCALNKNAFESFAIEMIAFKIRRNKKTGECDTGTAVADKQKIWSTLSDTEMKAYPLKINVEKFNQTNDDFVFEINLKNVDGMSVRRVNVHSSCTVFV